MTNWVPIKESLPAFGKEVLLKCKGWPPTLATYVANPHCQFSKENVHVCCGIWMLFDYKNSGRVVGAPIESWCEIPKIPKELKNDI